VLIIALQFIRLVTKELPVVNPDGGDKLMQTQKKARFWVSVGGASLVVVALAFAFISKNQLKETFSQAAIAKSGDVVEQKNTTPVQENPEPVKVEENKTVAIDTSKTLSTNNAVATTQENKETPKEQTVKPVATSNDYPSDNELKNNFPNFRGYAGNGIAYQKNIPTSWDGATGQNILWKVVIPLPGYNSPVIWGDKIFVAGANATKCEVYCFDRNSGKLLWTANADNITGSPAAAPKVQGDTGYSAPTISTDGKRVYAIFANGDILAIDMNGNRVWAKNIGVPQNHYGHSSSLITYKGLVIVEFDSRTNPRVLL
jgi:outer membrane protein assembly factor BamB